MWLPLAENPLLTLGNSRRPKKNNTLTSSTMHLAHHYLGTISHRHGPDLILGFTSTKKMTSCTLMFNQVFDYLGTSSHVFGCVFVLEVISAKQMTQQQGGNYYFLQQRQQ